jgi:hypothetical protein
MRKTKMKLSGEIYDEFCERIVKPYFKGDLQKAIEALMVKALQEEEMLQNHRPIEEEAET